MLDRMEVLVPVGLIPERKRGPGGRPGVRPSTADPRARPPGEFKTKAEPKGGRGLLPFASCFHMAGTYQRTGGVQSGGSLVSLIPFGPPVAFLAPLSLQTIAH